MLKGKTAIVTGGSRGIGAAIVKEFASQGADVAVIFAGNQNAAEEICAFCRSEYGVQAKLGVVVIPATHMLTVSDYVYRIRMSMTSSKPAAIGLGPMRWRTC